MEDGRLNRDSVRFHEKMGYRMVGRFSDCGYKFGHWYDMVWMEKIIGRHLPVQPPVRTFPEIEEKVREELGRCRDRLTLC
jgi:hypothetical protein